MYSLPDLVSLPDSDEKVTNGSGIYSHVITRYSPRDECPDDIHLGTVAGGFNRFALIPAYPATTQFRSLRGMNRIHQQDGFFITVSGLQSLIFRHELLLFSSLNLCRTPVGFFHENALR